MELLPTSVLQRCGIDPDASVLVALSGGADSVALLLLLSQAYNDGHIRALAAAHYHHGLRASADDDASFCKQLCETLDIPFHVGYGDVRTAAEAAGESIEAAARRLRYAYLRDVREQIRADCIATAHHADDQAETVLLHLLRGSGLRGLCGMQPRRGDIVRPLLHVPRADLLAYLSLRGQTFCTDETNADLRFTRNRVREELIPMLETYNPRIRASLCSMAELLSEDAHYLDKEAEQLLLTSAADGGYDRTLLAKAERPIRTRTLLQILHTRCGDDYRRTDAEKLDALLTAQTGTAVELRDGYAAWTDGRILRVGKREKPQPYSCPIHWSDRRFCIRVDGWKVSGECVNALRMPDHPMEACLCLDAFSAGVEGLCIRSKRDGDRFRPLGSKGTKLVSDIYTDRKYTERMRQAPLLFCGDELLFVPNYTIAEAARVTKESKTMIYLKIEEDEGE